MVNKKGTKASEKEFCQNGMVQMPKLHNVDCSRQVYYCKLSGPFRNQLSRVPPYHHLAWGLRHSSDSPFSDTFHSWNAGYILLLLLGQLSTGSTGFLSFRMSSWQLCCHTRPASAVFARPSFRGKQWCHFIVNTFLQRQLKIWSVLEVMTAFMLVKFVFKIVMKYFSSATNIINKSKSIDPWKGVRQLGQLSIWQV